MVVNLPPPPLHGRSPTRKRRTNAQSTRTDVHPIAPPPLAGVARARVPTIVAPTYPGQRPSHEVSTASHPLCCGRYELPNGPGEAGLALGPLPPGAATGQGGQFGLDLPLVSAGAGLSCQGQGGGEVSS